MSAVNEIDSKPLSGEALPEPPVEGVQIIGNINVAKLQAYASTAEFDAHLGINDEIPDRFEPVSEVVRLAWTRHPNLKDRFTVFLETFSFKVGDEDPFRGRDGFQYATSSNGMAHKDQEATIVTSDNYPTVFYPTKEDGQPDMDKGWQASPGQIVEFDKDVWHSPPYDVTEDGVRHLMVIVVPNE